MWGLGALLHNIEVPKDAVHVPVYLLLRQSRGRGKYRGRRRQADKGAWPTSQVGGDWDRESPCWNVSGGLHPGPVRYWRFRSRLLCWSRVEGVCSTGGPGRLLPVTVRLVTLTLLCNCGGWALRFQGPIEWTPWQLTSPVIFNSDDVRSVVWEGREILLVMADTRVKNAALRQPGGPLVLLDVPGHKVHLSLHRHKIVVQGRELVEPLLLPLDPLAERLGVNHLRRVLVPGERPALSDQRLLVLDPVLLLHQDQYGDQNSRAEDKCYGRPHRQVEQSLLLSGGGQTVGQRLRYEDVSVTGHCCQVEGDRGQDEDGVVPLRQLHQLGDAVVASEADIDNQTGHVGDRVDGHILVLRGAQAAKVYF